MLEEQSINMIIRKEERNGESTLKYLREGTEKKGEKTNAKGTPTRAVGK